MVNDCLIALRAGTQANYGAIVIAGTGANCAVRSPAGREWIYHYFIEGSLQGGVALGKRALEAIYKAETGRLSATRLTAGVLALFDLPGVDRLLREQVEGRLPADRVKDIAPLIFEFAGQGDIVSAELIRSFGAGLAELVTAGIRRLEMAALEVEVVLSGSIFKGPGRLLQEVMLANIHVEAPHARLVDARYEPVVGALLLGLEESGVLVDAAVKQNIEQGSQKFQLVRADR